MIRINNKPPKDFEFNAILWYYTVEDSAGNARTNLYGVSFLDNPDNKEHIAFINDYVCKDERIKFYINDKNMGLTNTLNRGLELAEGKYTDHRHGYCIGDVG